MTRALSIQLAYLLQYLNLQKLLHNLPIQKKNCLQSNLIINPPPPKNLLNKLSTCAEINIVTDDVSTWSVISPLDIYIYLSPLDI